MEEDIKNLKKYIELVIDKNYCECNELNVISCGCHCDGSKNVAYSIKNILNELERLQKENEELDYKLKQKICVEAHQQVKDHYTPKQVIRVKIEELNKQYKDYTEKWEKSGMNKEHPFYKYIIRIEAETDILKELLGE